MPRLQRGALHMDLGFAFINAELPLRALPHLWEAYFLLQESPVMASQASLLLQAFIEPAITESLTEVDHAEQLRVVDRAVAIPTDPGTLESLERIRTLLQD